MIDPLLAAALNVVWVAWGLGALAAFFIVRELFRKDERIEDRRRHAIEIAGELRAEGLEHIPSLLNDYAVGDYSRMIQRVQSWYDFLKDDDNRRAFFLKFLRTQLSRAMADEVRRAEVIKAVEEYQAVEEAKAAKAVEAAEAAEVVKTTKAKEATAKPKSKK
jgi:hypothetical protein